MSNTGGTRVPSGWGSTGGMTLGGVGAPEAARGSRGPVTPGWRKRGLAAWRRARKQNKIAKPGIAAAGKAAAPVKQPPKPKPDWLGVLDEKTVDDIVKRQAYQKFHPAFQEIASQKRVSDEQQKRIGDWYSQYQAQIGEAAKANAQAYGGAVGMVQGAAQRMAGQDEANRGALAEQQMADAQRRGVAYSPANDAVAQQASGSRLADANSFAALLAAEGAAGVARLQQQANVVVPGQAIQARTEEAARKRALEGKALDLLKEKGDYGVTLKDQKRDAERRHLLERLAFGLKRDEAQADYAAKMAELRAKQAKDRREMEKDAYQRKYGLGPYKKPSSGGGGSGGGGGGGGGGSKPKPAKPSAAYYKGMRQFQGSVDAYGTGRSDYNVATGLRKDGTPRVVILAAHEFARNGRVSGRVARMWLDAFGTPLPIMYRNGSQKAPHPPTANIIPRF